MMIDGQMLHIPTMDGNVELDTTADSLWVFGYGSLIWKPSFQFSSSEVGHIHGFDRRFWQGNTYHRGTDKQIARVATLVPSSELAKSTKDCYTYGVAFELKGREQIINALDHLNLRESVRGGYNLQMLDFVQGISCRQAGRRLRVLVCIATKESPFYLGAAPEEAIAEEICGARGIAGTNIEYLLKLCQWQRTALPEVTDVHLQAIERYCSRYLSDVLKTRPRCGEKCVEACLKWVSEPWVRTYNASFRKKSSSSYQPG